MRLLKKRVEACVLKEKNDFVAPITNPITTYNINTKINRHDYEIIKNADGSKSLRRYNETYNFWINLEFSLEEDNNRQKIIDLLKDIYIEKNTIRTELIKADQSEKFKT